MFHFWNILGKKTERDLSNTTGLELHEKILFAKNKLLIYLGFKNNNKVN